MVEYRFFRQLCVRVLLAAGAGLLGLGAAAQEPDIREYQVKAVLMYNFTRYTTWPTDIFNDPQTPFRLCVAGEDPFQNALDLAVENENVRGRRVEVVRLNERLNGLELCQILYVGKLRRYSESELIEKLGARAVLTVSDSENFIYSGGMVQFYNQGNKIRFAVNPDAVATAGLKISANLLHIAHIVRSVR